MLRSLGKTGLEIAPLVFGGNVLGWTIDEKTSFQVLDAFLDHGFNAIDTADVYSAWASGNKGGESETIVGNWLKARRGMRDKVVIFTKVGFPTWALPARRACPRNGFFKQSMSPSPVSASARLTSIFPTGLTQRPLTRRRLALMTSCLRPARCAQLALRTTTSNNLPQR